MNSEDKFDSQKFNEDLRDHIRHAVRQRIRERIRGRVGRGTRTSGMWLGVLMILFGTVVLLDHMGIISAEHWWRFWPVVLIVWGAVRFVECCNRAFSVFLMGLGILFLLGNLGYLRLTVADFWPIVLIGVGVMLVWGRLEMSRVPRASSPGGPNTVNEFSLFGGTERRVTVGNFAGGSATATFGGVQLDFRSADIEGEEAVLYVEAVFGGIEIIVPERWTVIYEGQSIFGGFTDETRPPLPEVPGAPPKKRLILRGRAVFGGITVKN